MTDLSPDSVKIARDALVTATKKLQTVTQKHVAAQKELTEAQTALGAAPEDSDKSQLTATVESKKEIEAKVQDAVTKAQSEENAAKLKVTDAITTALAPNNYPDKMCTALHAKVTDFKHWKWYKNRRAGYATPIMYFQAPFEYAGEKLIAVAHIHGKGLGIDGDWTYKGGSIDKIEVFPEVNPSPGPVQYIPGKEWEYNPQNPVPMTGQQPVDIHPSSMCDKVRFGGLIYPNIPQSEIAAHEANAQWPAQQSNAYPARIGYVADNSLYDGISQFVSSGDHIGMLSRHQ